MIMHFEHATAPHPWWRAVRLPYTDDIYIDIWFLLLFALGVAGCALWGMALARRHGPDGVIRMASLTTGIGFGVIVLAFLVMYLTPTPNIGSVDDVLRAIFFGLFMVLLVGSVVLAGMVRFVVGIGLWIGILLARLTGEHRR